MSKNIVNKIDGDVKIKRALISVSDKTGLDTFIPGLVEACPEIVIYSTGGTFGKIKEILGAKAEKHLIQVSDYTGQPETQGGLVKTLDFRIYLGLLTETYNASHQEDLKRTASYPIDMVIVNLYPFKETVAKEGISPEKARSEVDIGGPCMLRASAKNFIRVASVVNPSDYSMLLAELKKNNPQIPQNLKVLIAKDNMPNAFCLPDGTFIINMGLFNWMENKDQVAGVICHEIAHNVLEHSLKMLIAQINEDTSDKETLANIKTLSINKTETAFEIFKNRVYKKGIEKRHHEMQADSLGYALYKNSGFKKIEFLNALKNLNDFDSISPRELKTETYKSLFDVPNHPFKEKWM